MPHTSETHTLRLSKQIHTTAEKAFTAFTNADELSTWFTTKAHVDLRVGGRYANADHDTGVYQLIDPPHHLRFTWENPDHCPNTMVDIWFDIIIPDQIEVRLEHSRLESEKHVEDMKTGWSWALDSLKSFLETGRAISFDEWQRTQNNP